MDQGSVMPKFSRFDDYNLPEDQILSSVHTQNIPGEK